MASKEQEIGFIRIKQYNADDPQETYYCSEPTLSPVVRQKERGKGIGGRDPSEEIVFGTDPKVGLGIAQEEPKASQE